MLSFLDSLCGALIARDVLRIRQLLAHPLSRALPRAVRDEAAAIAAGGRETVAPLQACASITRPLTCSACGQIPRHAVGGPGTRPIGRWTCLSRSLLRADAGLHAATRNRTRDCIV